MRFECNDQSLDTPIFAEDAWHHFRFSRQSGKMLCWLNGVPNELEAVTADISSTDDMYIGATNISGLDNYFYGYIDDLRVTIGSSRMGAPTEAYPTY